ASPLVMRLSWLRSLFDIGAEAHLSEVILDSKWRRRRLTEIVREQWVEQQKGPPRACDFQSGTGLRQGVDLTAANFVRDNPCIEDANGCETLPGGEALTITVISDGLCNLHKVTRFERE